MARQHGAQLTRIILKDGRVAEMRLARNDEQDRALIHDLGNRVSKESLYMRFMHMVAELRDDFITTMIGDGGDNGAALMCLAGNQLLAVGNYIRVDETSAEVAFLVDDHIQKKGIGTLLLEYLADVAWNHGILRFEAYVLRENYQMLGVFRASGYELVSEFESDTLHLYLSLTHTEKFRSLREQREKRATIASLHSFFEPKTIAVIGASRDPLSLGYLLLKNILQNEFTGTVYPVNPTATSVSAVKAYPSIQAVPDTIDLAIIMVPITQVLGTVDDCIQAGVSAVMIISSGFSDATVEGRNLEQAILRKLRETGRRLIGPNSLGFINTQSNFHFNASLAPIMPAVGSIAVASHSGALGIAVLDYATRIGVGVSSFVSLGNRTDVSSNDLLQYWEDDDNTQVIVLYLESFGNPRKFWRITRRIARNKPIIAVKSARTASALEISKTRLNTLAARDVAVDALFRQAGIIRVNTLQELFDVAAILSFVPLPRGRKVAVVTNTAGGAVITVDTIVREGLEFIGPVINLGFEALAESYREVLPQVLKDPAIDAVVVIFTPVGSTDEEGIIQAITSAIEEAAIEAEVDETGQPILKPVVANFLWKGDFLVRYIQAGPQRVPVYPFPEHAIRALSKVVAYAEFKEKEQGVTPVFEDVDLEAIRALVRQFVSKGDTHLSLEAAQQVLLMLGAPIATDSVQQFADYTYSSQPTNETPKKQLYAREVAIDITYDNLFGPIMTLRVFHNMDRRTHAIPQVKEASRIMPLTDLDARELVMTTYYLAKSSVDEVLKETEGQILAGFLLRLSSLIEAVPEIHRIRVDKLEITPNEIKIDHLRIRLNSRE